MATPRPATKHDTIHEPHVDASGTRARQATYDCDSCGGSFEGPPAGSGLFLWTRGDEIRFEEPPLCDECASRITIGALVKWSGEEDEEG
jgi:hypothetical protein